MEIEDGGGVLVLPSGKQLEYEELGEKSRQHAALVRQQVARRVELIALLSGGRRWDPDEVADDTRYWVEQTSHAFWEACRRIAWAHLEFNDHARWLEWVGDKVGINRQHAYNYLAVATKLAGHDDRQKLLGLGQTKAIDLCLSLEEGELRALGQGDGQLELDLDEISRMSTRELRTRLRRRERELRQAKDKIDGAQRALDRANQKVGELTNGPPPPEKVLQNLDLAEAGFALQVDKLIRLFDEIDWPSAHPQLMANFSAVIESARVRLVDLEKLTEDEWHLHPEICNQHGVSTLVTIDEKHLYDEIVYPPRSTAMGEVFRLEEILPPSWTWARAEWALQQLVDKGFLERGDNPNEWVLLDTGPDPSKLIPEWMRRSMRKTAERNEHQDDGDGVDEL